MVLQRINFKHYYSIVFWAVSLPFIMGCGPGQTEEEVCGDHPNPFGLEIVHCTEDFIKQAEENPDMKMVDLEKYLEGVQMDIRYATENNFTGEVIYTAPKAYARKAVSRALREARDSLNRLGLDFRIYDAYRPYEATVKFFEIYPDPDFLADPEFGSRHNRGCAVDVTLVDIETGEEIPMPTDFDEFTERAHPEYTDLPEEAIENRELLFGIMDHFGFKHYPTEWWHFDYVGWEDFPLMDLSFEQLEEILE